MNADEIQAGRETVNFEVEFCKMVHAQGKNIVVEIFEKRLNRVAEVALQALDALSAAEQDRAAVRRETLLEIARAVCWKCKAGKEVVPGIPYDSLSLTETYCHPTDGKQTLYLACRASLLHEKLAADADQGQPEELDSYTDKKLKCTGCMGPCGRCDEADQGQAGKEG